MKDNTPAFPCEAYDLDRKAWVKEEGMTLRDYFAAKAMQGLIAADTVFTMSSAQIAEQAYDHADAMMKARK